MIKPEEHTDLTARSAGRHMIQKMPTIHPAATIAEVEELLLKKTRDLETINYIYVTDNQNKLIGVISVKEVFRLPKTRKIAEVMEHDVVTARPHTDQERVALLAIEHNLKEIPVVDSESRLLGVVPYDAILRVLREEHIEDILQFAGIHKFKDPAKDIIGAPAWTHLKKRLPWLVVGLLGGLIAALVVGYFEAALKIQLILASFIPAIVYMADAVGAQTQTIFIRSLAIEQKLNLVSYIWREVRVGLSIAVFLGLMIAVITYFLWPPATLALILGLSFIATIIAAMAVAIFLPWLFLKIKIDPAIASGPFATVIRDILSLVIYFAIASAMLGTVIASDCVNCV